MTHPVPILQERGKDINTRRLAQGPGPRVNDPMERKLEPGEI